MVTDFKSIYIERIASTSNIDVAMFGFGLVRNTMELKAVMHELYNPIKDKLKAEWSQSVFMEIITAGNSEEIWEKEGVDIYELKIKHIQDIDGPSWTYYYMFGEVTGAFIDDEITANDVEKCLELLPDHLKSSLLELTALFGRTVD